MTKQKKRELIERIVEKLKGEPAEVLRRFLEWLEQAGKEGRGGGQSDG